jgi:L-fucose isomerase
MRLNGVFMNNKIVGLISTMSLDNTWAEEVIQRVSSTHFRVKGIIEDMGYTVLDEGSITRQYKDMEDAGRALRAKKIKVLVIYVGTWTYANCAVAAALQADVPVIIWADAEPGTCGLVGGSIARGGMDEYGIYSHMVYGRFNDEPTLKRLNMLLNAACAAKGLDGTIMGLGGGRSMGMVTAVCDPNKLKKQFGIEVDSFEQLDVINRAELIEESIAIEFLGWMKNTFGKFIAKDEVIIKQIKLYLALKDFCKEKHYDFVAIKCLPELPSIYTTFCLAHAICGDDEDAYGKKERFILSCEADINAAITMQLMLYLTGGPVMFTDLTQYDFASDVLTTCNCGSQPTDFAKCKKDVNWEIEGIHEFKWKYGGCCPQHVGKPGKVTMARLSVNDGKYEMLITSAEAVEMPREKLRETIWERPHTYFKLISDKQKFFDAVRSNHIHVVYGNWEEDLVEACNIMGIKPNVVK